MLRILLVIGFICAGSKVYRTVAGFNGVYLLAEPIWMTLDCQGLTGVVAVYAEYTVSIG